MHFVRTGVEQSCSETLTQDSQLGSQSSNQSCSPSLSEAMTPSLIQAVSQLASQPVRPSFRQVSLGQLIGRFYVRRGFRYFKLIPFENSIGFSSQEWLLSSIKRYYSCMSLLSESQLPLFRSSIFAGVTLVFVSPIILLNFTTRTQAPAPIYVTSASFPDTMGLPDSTNLI